MDSEKTFKAMEAWQSNSLVHPLTCGNDSNHEPLKPKIENDKCILYCVNCDYKQTFVPSPVIDSFIETDIRLKSINEIDEDEIDGQIEVRQNLIKRMVGNLYPHVMTDEIIKLRQMKEKL